MEFETPRLVIRPIRHKDNPQLLALLNLPQVKAYNDYGDNLTEVDLKCMIQMDIERQYEGRGGRFCLVCKSTKAVIGCIGFYHEDGDIEGLHIGYELLPDYWGKGVMFEALRCLFANKSQIEFKLNVILAHVSADNHRSLNLLKRLGFCAVGNNLYKIEL
ncbi:GNAT family N-acetyltransferase [Pseudoalteromonas maricaloris]|uniref:GNAT family N-acetyltransferase n=1 Tax=Pseudoalteromonas maricaloris TaxID=184924 RepID=A0A8I2KPV1_9GAMM|nr:MULTISPECIES: GNAT family N-acetyltransferase [Pseudoalteromonas]KID34817.1 alanine acetyltransferase [Pseudoalteromonas flavipulchra NCIMB 2033 = ATCC BAA-314]MBD0784038.1 GNAT family N-acetyltransferase [Pseudoalteromonas flavipulchra]MBE0372865.1 ribosomal-protein-alanine N-acetyltransferase [Pseudoalteromonas flavipulchra NCIMB 2033 = ATCC BAA-314]NLR24276.1 GNAT family N-acetyltransferase [Pseudoalteromonas maricaloris]WOX26881.1 GNAT family N-acetyltransferase [Pseudoalteromonas maric